MNSIPATARLAGIFYLLMSILAIIGYFYLPSTYYVAGDATATARKISENVLLYRLGNVNALLTDILFLFVVLTLYRLFRDVDRDQARIMVILVCVPGAAQIANLSYHMAPLTLLSGADYLRALPKSELDALAFADLRIANGVGQLLTVFWGLWLFPFGILTIKSGFFPKFLGILLFVSGFAYIVTFVTTVLFSGQFPVISRIMMPLYFGELAMVLWLPIMGARAPRGGAALARGLGAS